jgi:hypothetical protein
MGVDLAKYANELAAIHTVLKRLNEGGEARFIPRGPGKDAYLWARPTRAIAIGPEIAEFLRGSVPRLAPHAPASSRPAASKPKRTPK